MVEERFSEAQLPEEFVEQIKTLLDLAIDKAQRQAAIKRLQAVCLLRRWGKLTQAQRRKAQQDEHVAVRQAAA